MKEATPILTRSNAWACSSRAARLSPESSPMRRKLSLRPPRVRTGPVEVTVIDKKPGAPPGKDDKGKKPGEEVISPEEKERQEKEAAAREER